MATGTAEAKRNVQTELAYWRQVPGQKVVNDFTQPDGEKGYAEMTKYDDRHEVIIHDIRGEESDFTLDRNGFQYVKHDVPELDDWSDEAKVKQVLIPATEKLVQQLTNAVKTIVFATRIRCFATDDAKGADNRAPAHSVHSDFTPAGALRNLDVIIKDPTEVERLTKGRVLAINVWRPLKTITKDPLAVCDWTSVNPKSDWIANRLVFPHGWHELGKVAHSEKHKWYYLNRQKPNEPLVFKQFDSDEVEKGCYTLAHSAFVDPDYVDDNARESIEIKMFAFIPKDV